MWYHYVAALIFAYLVIQGIYSQVRSSFSSVFSRITSIALLMLYSGGLYWAYSGIMYVPPPVMFGGRGYR